MTDVETLEERVNTVERAVTDGDHGFPAVDELAELTERIETLEGQVSELNDRADELEAATQALRGYVGNVRSVNERVEGRADAALAATERLERRLDAVADERRSVDAGDAGPASVADHEPREVHTEGCGIGGATQRASGANAEDEATTNSAASEASETDTRSSGVLEQIRSLL